MEHFMHDDANLANALGMAAAGEMEDAMSAALKAMAHFGSDAALMEVISAFHVEAIKQGATAFRALEKTSTPPAT